MILISILALVTKMLLLGSVALGQNYYLRDILVLN